MIGIAMSDTNTDTDKTHINTFHVSKGEASLPLPLNLITRDADTSECTPQSHNYEPDESEVWRAYVAQQHFRNRGQWWTTGKRRALKRWLLTFLVGVCQACIAYFCNMAARNLNARKFDHVNGLLQDEVHGVATPGSAFVMFLFYQTTFAILASIFVIIEPVSAGSGIPEIKCYLNGIDLPRVVRVRTLICKVVGVVFSVAAGLPVGKEGPMVHSGSVVAAGFSQGKTKFWGVDTSFSKFSDFRNEREKRDFVACGAAAGVCSAFGAPIGGVLFSLEEGASYWSTKLTWRAFFCAMITLGTLYSLKNLDNWWGQADIENLFSFGEFNSITGEASNYSIWELILFIIIGCLGGLIGAVFNASNEHITIWRMRNVNHSKARRFMEVVLVSVLVSTVSFLLPLIWMRCTDLPNDMQDWSNQVRP